MQHRRGASLLLEIILGLTLLLLVVLLVSSLFPGSYQGSLQAARMSYAVQLSRQVLERQKRMNPAEPLGDQRVESPLTVQGRPVVCQFNYRIDLESEVGAVPKLWKVTVEWEHTGKVKQVVLVGASPVR